MEEPLVLGGAGQALLPCAFHGQFCVWGQFCVCVKDPFSPWNGSAILR